MSYQPKCYRLYAAGAVAAALVGFSFTPIANAEAFSDLDENSHKEAILSLVEQRDY